MYTVKVGETFLPTRRTVRTIGGGALPVQKLDVVH